MQTFGTPIQRFGQAFGQPGNNSAAPIVNTVAPAINTSAVIGTQINGDDGTWTGSPSFTYQWQRNGSDISGATSKNYTPIDAGFGYPLRLGVIPNGDASKIVYSNATNLVREAPAQSFGANLIVNGDLETGSISPFTTPNSANLTVTTTLPHAGTYSLGVARTTVNSPRAEQAVLSSGSYYQNSAWGRGDGSSGAPRLNNGISLLTTGATSVSWQQIMALFRATNTAASFGSGASSGTPEVDFDDMAAQLVTLNAQLTAPSADMRITQFYTLPGSPANGTQMWVLPRISDFASGNYWFALLTYTGTQWNITLYSAAAFTLTSRTSATNIGSTNGLRVNMNGSSITLETTADGGSNWTARGTLVTNATYSTATGVNALWTNDITANNLVFEAAV